MSRVTVAGSGVIVVKRVRLDMFGEVLFLLAGAKKSSDGK